MRPHLAIAIMALALALAACSQGSDAPDTDAVPEEIAGEPSGEIADGAQSPDGAEGDAPTSDDGFASAYTPLDLDDCDVLDRSIDEGNWVELRCAGYRGIPLFVSEGDLRFDVDAGVANENFQTVMAFNTLGDSVEWRLREGEPFATIIRYRDVGTPGSTRTILAVDRIGRPGAPGCRVAQIAGDTPGANRRARQIADAEAAAFDCAQEPRYIGDAR